VDVSLEIGQCETRQRELRAKRPLEMVEVHLDGAEAVGFHRPVVVRSEILLFESGEVSRLSGGNRLFGGLSTGKDELINSHAGRKGQELLLESQQEQIGAAREGFSLVVGRLAHGYGVPLTQVAELAVVAIVLLLQRSHAGTPDWAMRVPRYRDACRKIAEEFSFVHHVRNGLLAVKYSHGG
jgi:hypothetical protein